MEFGTRVGSGVNEKGDGWGGVAGAVIGQTDPVVVGEDELHEGVSCVIDAGGDVV